jgi:hypothetical protein
MSFNLQLVTRDFVLRQDIIFDTQNNIHKRKLLTIFSREIFLNQDKSALFIRLPFNLPIFSKQMEE